MNSAERALQAAVFIGLGLLGFATHVGAEDLRTRPAGGGTDGRAYSQRPAGTPAATGASKQRPDFEWLAFPDPAKFKVPGLHWFSENAPRLWRLPKGRINDLPKGVQARCKAPAGGRIVMRCNSTKLGLKVTPVNKSGSKGFDVYVDGKFLRSVVADKAGQEMELVLLEGLDSKEKEVVVYLPYQQEVTISAVGVDAGARFGPPEQAFAKRLPVVFYGSSVCQGSGAARPGMSYEAILCRELNLDFVNLGFGGAGKAEPEVVELVKAIPACCYVFDLGKSYGSQDATAYKNMLVTVRKAHPDVPIICITPITSAREVRDASYSERSVHTRRVMREPVKELIAAGDKRLYLVEGEDLLGFKEHDGLSKDGVHPSDEGYLTIARKLSPILKKALGL